MDAIAENLAAALREIASQQPTNPEAFDEDGVALYHCGNEDDTFHCGWKYGEWLCGEIARKALAELELQGT